MNRACAAAGGCALLETRGESAACGCETQEFENVPLYNCVRVVESMHTQCSVWQARARRVSCGCIRPHRHDTRQRRLPTVGLRVVKETEARRRQETRAASRVELRAVRAGLLRALSTVHVLSPRYPVSRVVTASRPTARRCAPGLPQASILRSVSREHAPFANAPHGIFALAEKLWTWPQFDVPVRGLVLRAGHQTALGDGCFARLRGCEAVAAALHQQHRLLRRLR